MEANLSAAIPPSKTTTVAITSSQGERTKTTATTPTVMAATMTAHHSVWLSPSCVQNLKLVASCPGEIEPLGIRSAVPTTPTRTHAVSSLDRRGRRVAHASEQAKMAGAT